MQDARYLAARLLDKTFSSGSYSNIQLGSGLDNSDLDERNKRLCSAIYYGVIERKLTLDHIISSLSSRKIEKLDSIIVTILRCGLYQLLYMESVPDNAAVNESVSLAKRFGKGSASGMVNAVLRSFIRSGKTIPMPDDQIQAMSVKYSAPVWLIESLSDDYGADRAQELLSDAIGQAGTTVRRNDTICSEEQFLASLGDISAVRSEILPLCYHLSGGDITSSEGFEKGYFHVQDLASQLCCLAVSPSENDEVLDICAAPGGKTFTMAEMMNGKGSISAFDLHEKRVRLIKNGAKRLHLENITASQGDASKFDPDMPQFTKVLCDVPCSGLGAVRRKPEIKYKNPADFDALPEIQYNIAQNALRYLAPGGEMVYSTCTLRRKENDEVVDRLLKANPDIEELPLPEPLGSRFGCRASIFPGDMGSDGFFIARLRKKN